MKILPIPDFPSTKPQLFHEFPIHCLIQYSFFIYYPMNVMFRKENEFTTSIGNN